MKTYADARKVLGVGNNINNNIGCPVECNIYRSNGIYSSQVEPYTDKDLKVVRIISENNANAPVYIQPKGIKWTSSSTEYSVGSVKGSSRNPLINKEYQDKVTEYFPYSESFLRHERILYNRVNGVKFIYVGNRPNLRGFAPYHFIDYQNKSYISIYSEAASDFENLNESFYSTPYGKYLFDFMQEVTNHYVNDRTKYGLLDVYDETTPWGNAVCLNFRFIKINDKLVFTYRQSNPKFIGVSYIKLKFTDRSTLQSELWDYFIDCSKNIGDEGFITTLDELFPADVTEFTFEQLYTNPGRDIKNRNTLIAIYNFKHEVPYALKDKQLGITDLSGLPVFKYVDVEAYFSQYRIAPCYQIFFKPNVLELSNTANTINEYTNGYRYEVLEPCKTISIQEGTQKNNGYVLDSSFDYSDSIICSISSNTMGASGGDAGLSFKDKLSSFIQGCLNLKGKIITNRSNGDTKLTFQVVYGKGNRSLTLDGNLFTPNDKTSQYDALRTSPTDVSLFNFVLTLWKFIEDSGDKSIEITRLANIAADKSSYSKPTILRGKKNKNIIYYKPPNQVDDMTRTLSDNESLKYAIIDSTEKTLLNNRDDIVDLNATDTLTSDDYKDIQLLKWYNSYSRNSNKLKEYAERYDAEKSAPKGEYLVDSKQLYTQELLRDAPVYIVVNKIFKVFGNPNLYKRVLPINCVFFRIDDIYQYNANNIGISGFNPTIIDNPDNELVYSIAQFKNVSFKYDLSNFTKVGVKVMDRVFEVQWDTKEATEAEILANNFKGDKAMSKINSYYTPLGIYPIGEIGVYKLNLTMNTTPYEVI